MSIFRKILIAVLALSITVCAGIALAACKDDNKILNPDGETVFNGNYEITVKSQGGLLLDGIKLTFEKDGVQYGEQCITKQGKATIKLAPDVYDVKVDTSAKAGYFVPAGAEYKTKADSKDVSVILTSKVIESETPANTKYQLGDVMYDFSFVDVDGVTHKLSETLKTKNTVVLNFWGTQCQPCKNEFPALQSAYDSYKNKLELFALSSYATSMNGADTEADIIKFRDVDNKGAYKFPMALDTETKIYSYFDLSKGYPTTYVIDRYGVVAWRLAGTNPNEASWRAVFGKYTSDNYSQSINPGGSIGGDENIDRVPPDEGLSTPASEDIRNAICNNIAQEDVEFYFNEDNPNADTNWPWQIGEKDGNKYLYASNVNTKESWSTIYCNLTLNGGESLSFDYYINTHSTNNALYVVANGAIICELFGESDGWLTQQVYTANRRTTLNISFVYIKNDAVLEDTPVYIDNIKIFNPAESGEPLDIAYSVTDNTEFKDNKYNVKLELDDEGLYHYVNGENNSILYADILGVASWAEKHFGSTTFEFLAEDAETPSTYRSSLYYLAYFKMSNLQGVGLEFNFGYTDAIIKLYNLQAFATSGNGYLPVTEEVKEMICAFINYAYEIGIVDDEYYDDQWLEFCYYFKHWNSEHIYIDKNLYIDEVPVEYVSATDSYVVNSETGHADKNVYIDFHDNGVFGVIVNNRLKYYSLEDAINAEMLASVYGNNYTEIMKSYLKAADANEGELKGFVKADKKLTDILGETLRYTESILEMVCDADWKIFANCYRLGDCDTAKNPLKGLIFDFAYDAQLGTNNVEIKEIININAPEYEAGGGIKFKFTPETSGVHLFSSSYKSNADPRILVSNSEFNLIAEQENDIRYDHFNLENPDNFYLYVNLNANETYYITASLNGLAQATYKMDISYVAPYVEMLRVATTGDGTWLPRPSLDENGNIKYDENGEIVYNWNDTYYDAVETAYDRSADVYRVSNPDGTRGAVLYIDFVHTTYYSLTSEDGKKIYYPTLYELITLYNRFDSDTKAELLEYYKLATARDESDELYGLIEADGRLVEILRKYMNDSYNDNPNEDNRAWEMFACYYETYGTPEQN